VTRNTALRLLAATLLTTLYSIAIGEPGLNYVGLFVWRGLSTVALGNLLVALLGNGHEGRRYASGGDL